MDFNFSNEQIMLQETVRKFTEKEIEPFADKIDSNGKLPDDLINKMADIGLFGMTIPEKYGGTGVGHLGCIIACEQLAYSGTGAWWLVGFNNSIPDSIAHFGSEELKKKYLRPICNGVAYASLQFTEEDTGSDPGALRTTALPSGDFYIINGMKRFSTFGKRNGYAILYVKDENNRCSAFIIEKNVEGYAVSKVWDLMGGGGIEAADVYFENMKVSKENLLGVKGEGVNILLSWIADEKIQQCGACVGIAQAALDEAVSYAKTRTVKGKPQASLQGIRWMLAEMCAQLEAARWLTYRTAFCREQAHSDWMTKAAAAKVFVVPATETVVGMARRIHGGYGYTKEFKIDRLYRAIAGASSIAVSLEINKSIVSASLLRRQNG